MTLAEIIAEGERQIANYQTMILPHGDARRLLAVARAAVEMREAFEALDYHRTTGKRLLKSLAAFDAAAAGADATGDGR